MAGEGTLQLVEPLSPREREVLAALGEHLTNAEIADRFVLSVRTVESHVSSLLRKTGARDRRALAAHAARATTQAGAPAGVLRRAPLASTGFVGRASAMAALTDALASERLVTLAGPGGAGKTRLATQVANAVAQERADGGWFVDLTTVTDGHVAAAVAAAIGVIEPPGTSLVDALAERLGPSDGLLVLDNCEHVLDPAAALADRLRSGGGSLSILATSREALGLAGERVVALGPLDADGDGRELFVQRARAADASFDPEQHGSAIAEICRRLDGLPLAVELAAARVPALGVDGLLGALDGLLDLASGGRGATERHRSLRSVLDWSIDLLEPDELDALLRLSVVAGPVAAAEAAELLGRPVAVLVDLLGRLTTKSLLARSALADGVSGWRMLETVRAYAGELLDASGGRAAAAADHLAWAGRVAAGIEPGAAGWPDAFDARAGDLRAAVAWADVAAAQDVSYTLRMRLGELLYARRFFAEAQQRFVEAGDVASGSAAAVAWRRAAEVALVRMRGPDWLALFERAGVAARTGGDAALAAVCFALGAHCIGRFQGEIDAAAQVRAPEMLDEALRAAEAVAGDPVVAAHIAVARVWTATNSPFPGDADVVEAAETAVRGIGDPVLLSAVFDALTMVAWRSEPARAVDVVLTRVAQLADLDPYDPRAGVEILDVLHMATDVELQAGRLVDGRASALRQRDSDIPSGAAHIGQRGLVIAYGLTGELDACLDAAATMLDGWERVGRPPAAWMAPALLAAMMAATLLGRADEAARLLAIAEEVGETAADFRPFARARVALLRGDPSAALAAYRADRPELATAGWAGYAIAVAAEAALACRDPEAPALVETATAVAAWHPWARAALARAHAAGDPAALADAAALFEDAGAEVEALLTRAAGGDARAREELTRRGVVGFA